MALLAGATPIGGFVGSAQQREVWIRKKVDDWADGVKVLAGIAKRYPQTAYAGLTMCLQAEWQYVCRTTSGIGALFAPVEENLRDLFLPNLLGEVAIDGELRLLMAQGVKQAGLAVRNPVECAARSFATSKEAVSKLTASMVSGEELCLAEHRKQVRTAGKSARDYRIADEDAANNSRINRLGPLEEHRLARASSAGIWLSCVPNRFNGTELSAEEFRDNLRLRYNLKPLGLLSHCDGCGKKGDVEHFLSCKVGGLVHIRHDDTAHEFGELCAKAYQPSRVSYEPLINASRGAQETDTGANAPRAQVRRGHRPRANQNLDDITTTPDERADQTHAPYVVDNENRGDVAVDGYWKKGRRCIFDIRITDTECRSTRNQEPSKVLAKCEKLKKDKHLHACLERRRDFTPLVYSVDGMAGRETKMAERQLARALAHKWNREYSEMVAFVRARMALAVVRSNTLLLRGARVRRSRRPYIDEGAAMDGWQTWRERL